MLRPYDLLSNVLIDIENGVKGKIYSNTLAEKYTLSERHLRRLFKFAFNLPLSQYIRMRKLAASLDDLLNTERTILDIALQYGFGYEQTYIRAFKQEFGTTPGELRNTKPIVKVKPPLHLFDENNLGDGLLFGPEIVMVPEFNIIGKFYDIPNYNTLAAQQAGIDFWENERKRIVNAVNPDVYIGMTRGGYNDNNICHYLPSLQVNSIDFVPEGFCADTFKSSLCARFRYIGQHHYYEINRITAKSMYNAIHNFTINEQNKYALKFDKVFFEKIDTSVYDGIFCQMEWFAPVIEKLKMSKNDNLELWVY